MSSVVSYNIKALIRALARQTGELSKSKAEISRLAAELAELKRRPAMPGQSQKPSEKEQVRKKAAVVCWDVGHNPAGRGLVLYELLEQNYETTLIGPSWSRYGQGLWPPLQDLGLRTDIFCCNDLADFLPQAMIAATRVKYDLVYVSKPRLPSLYLGFLIKQISHCPLILDVDDHELSFFPDRKPATIAELRTAGQSALLEPYQGLATRFSENLIPHADAITVSNIALRSRYGGTIVRHARNEAQFDPALFDRDAIRAELGIARDEFSFLFVGTPRAHKGIFEIADALKRINDGRISLHIVGDSGDRSVSNKIASYAQYRVRHHPSRSFAELPRLLAAADCVPLIQDLGHAISQYQIPAKISDALALGVPILLSDVPPVRDLLSRPGIVVAKQGELEQAIRHLTARDRQVNRDNIRLSFLDEFSNAVNGARLNLAIKQALAHPKPVPDIFEQVKKELRSSFTETVKSAITKSFHIASVAPKEHTFDVALFWKQNDSGVYGRRSDMIAKHLIKSGRVRRLLFFDAPLKDSDLLSI
ncbi:MAG: glycosyltransferase, partial [Thermomicrobiales bacterium]